MSVSSCSRPSKGKTHNSKHWVDTVFVPLGPGIYTRQRHIAMRACCAMSAHAHAVGHCCAHRVAVWARRDASLGLRDDLRGEDARVVLHRPQNRRRARCDLGA